MNASTALELKSIERHFHYLHENPALAFEEHLAAEYIAGKLREWGYEVETGIGKTGVVARLKVGDGKTSIGLRADTDALPVEEAADLPYKSKVPGKSHMCRHDAHTSMLLGAAEYLAKTRNFNGTLNLVFQPAEETMAGAPAMIADGLFERYPMDVMFGMHNMPGLPREYAAFHERADHGCGRQLGNRSDRRRQPRLHAREINRSAGGGCRTRHVVANHRVAQRRADGCRGGERGCLHFG